MTKEMFTSRTALALELALTLAALTARPAAAQYETTGPTSARPQHGMAMSAPASRKAVAGLPSVRWNQLARDFMTGPHGGGTGLGTRPLAILSVAQAAAAGDAATATPLRALAVATASAEVVRTLFPMSAAQVEAVLAQDRAAAARAGLDAAARDRADSLGRAAAAQVFARVQGDGDGAAWQGNLPTGSGMWTSASDMKPMGATWGQVRPWVLARADQFRPAPPPAVGTPAFTRALAEVRSAVANLTPAQRASAVKWAATGMPTYWNEVAVDLITKDRVPGPRAIEVLTALNVALMDANIACFDAKYHYWGIRPSQADTTIELPVPLPNFPAYPSGHACLSEAAATVLGHYFPAQRAQLLATSQEVGMARLYGGVHYRHDNEVGAAMGRQVAQAVLAAASRGVGQLASR